MRFRFIWASKSANPSYHYGMLLFILGLLTWNILWLFSLSPTYKGDPYMGSVVILMMLLNHLAYQFTWPAPIHAVLRIVTWSWTILGLLYLVCISPLLYPK